MINDQVVYSRIRAARTAVFRQTQSFYIVAVLGSRLLQYAVDNRIGKGEIVDMAFLEFLEKRGINIKEIPPQEIIDPSTVPAV